MIFSSPNPLPVVPGTQGPASASLSFDDATPSVCAVLADGQSMPLNVFHAAPNLGPAIADGTACQLVGIDAPVEGVFMNVVDASGAVLAHLSSGAAQWSPPVAWLAASVQHDGAGNVRVVDAAGNVLRSL